MSWYSPGGYCVGRQAIPHCQHENHVHVLQRCKRVAREQPPVSAKWAIAGRRPLLPCVRVFVIGAGVIAS